MLKTFSHAAKKFFLETVTHSKEQHLFETEIFPNFCTVTFDQFNVSLLSKTINFI